jgi:molybdopterin/thiamine biosynthesis adenylyltransferase
MRYGAAMKLSDEELDRYARHIVLREVGGAGQARLKAGRVLAVGAGGLGSAVLLYLAAAGVGTIGIVDDDRVSLSNLQRQIAHATPDVGRFKTDSATDRIRAINPNVDVRVHRERLTAANALEIVSQYDVIADGSDNFATRFLVNDACFLSRRTLVSAAVTEFDGQLATFKAHDRSHPYPCYRCFVSEPPPPGTAPSCSESGVLGAAAGVMGTLQALEVIKEIAQVGESLAGHLLIYDALTTNFRKVRLAPDPACALCGDDPKVTSLTAA